MSGVGQQTGSGSLARYTSYECAGKLQRRFSTLATHEHNLHGDGRPRRGGGADDGKPARSCPRSPARSSASRATQTKMLARTALRRGATLAGTQRRALSRSAPHSYSPANSKTAVALPPTVANSSLLRMSRDDALWTPGLLWRDEEHVGVGRSEEAKRDRELKEDDLRPEEEGGRPTEKMKCVLSRVRRRKSLTCCQQRLPSHSIRLTVRRGPFFARHEPPLTHSLAVPFWRRTAPP